jgi:hypothetical protein
VPELLDELRFMLSLLDVLPLVELDVFPLDVSPLDVFPLDVFPLDVFPLAVLPPAVFPLEVFPLDVLPASARRPEPMLPHSSMVLLPLVERVAVLGSLLLVCDRFWQSAPVDREPRALDELEDDMSLGLRLPWLDAPVELDELD